MDFAQGALRDLLVDEEPTVLLVVRDEVFDARSNAGTLDGVDVLGGQLARQEWVFAVRLEVSSTERCPRDADFEAN